MALLAIPVGWYIFLTPKGTPRHRLIGRIWVLWLSIVAITALLITAINPGHYSVIHLLIPYTLASLLYSIWNIRKFKQTKRPKYKRAHVYSMIGVYIDALVIAGAFTLMLGRFFIAFYLDKPIKLLELPPLIVRKGINMSNVFTFAKQGKVSVWFSTEPYNQVPDTYFEANKEGFEPWMQNFSMTDIDLENLELNGVEAGLAPIIDMLAPCSYSSAYASLVEHKIKKMGESQIAWILLLFDYEYRPKKTKIYQDDILRFVGSYPYDMDDKSLVEPP